MLKPSNSGSNSACQIIDFQVRQKKQIIPKGTKKTPKLKLTLRTGDFDLLPIQEEARMLDMTFLVLYYFAFMVLNILTIFKTEKDEKEGKPSLLY